MNNANPLVSQLMKARYYADSDFIDAALGANRSYMCRSILTAQEMMKQGRRRKIGMVQILEYEKFRGYLVSKMVS